MTFNFLILIFRITPRKKKKVKPPREANLDLSQGRRRAETETGRGTERGGDPSPDQGPERGRRKAKRKRETDLGRGPGRDTAGTGPETGTGIRGTGEMTERGGTEIRTTRMN